MLETLLSVLLSLLLGWTEVPPVPTPLASATTTAQVVSVIDGDTIDVNLNGTVERVRYIGIDTPEPYENGDTECYAAQASDANAALVQNKTVTLVADSEDRDTYNRLLRYVYVDAVFVQAELMRSGYATALPIEPNTTHAGFLYELQQTAQQEALGLWGACAS